MHHLQALIFDVDGTLADTERDGHREAFNRAFQAAGLDWHWSVALYGELLEVAGGKERIRRYIDQYQPGFAASEAFSDTFIADLHKAKTDRYRQIIAEDGIPLRPGVTRLIAEARAEGLRLAIATTSALPNVLALLEQTLNPSWFEVIAAGDIVPAKKPAPDIYLYVLDKLNLPPTACLVLEDSAQGLAAATTAGLPTVITANGYTQHHNFSNALLVLDGLGERDRPFTILGGSAAETVGNATYFDISVARRLCG